MRANRLMLVLGAAVLFRLTVAFSIRNTLQVLPAVSDQISYHTLATRLTAGHGFTFDKVWWPNTPAGQPTAHWSYLYALFLAGLYAAFGAYPLLPRLVQAVLAGMLMPWLAYRIGSRASGETTGIVTAGWAAVYGYFIYYAAALMTETFYIIGILWVLDCGLRIANHPQSAIRNPQPAVSHWLELGLAIGLTVLLRQVFLLFAPFLFAWLWWVWLRQAPSARHHISRCTQRVSRNLSFIRGSLIAFAVVAAVITPVTLFNYRQFGRFVLLNTNAGYAFFWANHPIYGDRFVPILTPDMPSYQELIPIELRHLNEADLDNALMERAIGFIVDDPARYLRLSLSRLPAYFMFWPSSESSPLSNIVRLGSFGLALPFMLVGVGLWFWDGLRRDPAGGLRSPGALLLLFALFYTLIHLLSWALIRYRLPVDAVLLVFAGRALAEITAQLRRIFRPTSGKVFLLQSARD